jgi:hypothetical protein
MHPTAAPPIFLAGIGPKVWTNPRGKHTLIMLSGGSLFLANPRGTDLETAVEMLITGSTPEMIFGKDMLEISLSGVIRAEMNFSSFSVRLVYLGRHGHTSTTFTLSSPVDVEELFTVFQTEFSSFQTRPYRRPAVVSVLPALIAMFVHLIVFGAAWSLTNPFGGPYRRSRNSIGLFIQEQLGSSGVLLIGTAVALALVGWLVTRLAWPPPGVTFYRVGD